MSSSSNIVSWNYPTSVTFGVGAIARLPDAVKDLSCSRPLLITDTGLVNFPMVSDAVRAMKEAGLEAGLYGGASPNPTGRDVSAAVAEIKRGNYDCVIAFGGGSAIDVAKAAALVAHQSRPLWDFEDVGDNYLRVEEEKMLPVVAVPTTSGTGSEVGRASVIIETATHTKRIIFHPGMLPARVVADPGLTVGLPANLTAAVGMDALSHNLEAYCVPGFHPQADGIAVEGMRLVNNSLLRAFHDGSDLDARSDMMAASLMGATAFQKGLGGMHALAHPIGAVHGAHHGLINAVVMPYVLLHNRSAVAESLGRLALAIGLGDVGFDGVIDWVLNLRRVMGIPNTLFDLGIKEVDLKPLVPMVLNDTAAGGNPILLTEEGVYRLLLNAWSGQTTQYDLN